MRAKIVILLLGVCLLVNAQPSIQKFWALNQPLLLNNWSGVSAAYSVRKLRSAYTGFCMKARISNRAEGNVAFNGTVINDNSDVTITKAGNGYSLGDVIKFKDFYYQRNVYVITWYDQSGNGNNATNTSNPPLIVNSGALITENSLPSIEFSGSHSTINLKLNSPLSLTNGSLFAVYNVLTPDVSCGVAQDNSATYSYNLNTYNNTGYLGVTHYGDNDFPSNIHYNTTLDVASWSKSSSNNYVEINNRIVYSTVNFNMPINIGQIYGNSLSNTVLHISEIIVTGYTNSSQRVKVFTNQRTWFHTP